MFSVSRLARCGSVKDLDWGDSGLSMADVPDEKWESVSTLTSGRSSRSLRVSPTHRTVFLDDEHDGLFPRRVKQQSMKPPALSAPASQASSRSRVRGSVRESKPAAPSTGRTLPPRPATSASTRTQLKAPLRSTTALGSGSTQKGTSAARLAPPSHSLSVANSAPRTRAPSRPATSTSLVTRSRAAPSAPSTLSRKQVAPKSSKAPKKLEDDGLAASLALPDSADHLEFMGDGFQFDV